MTDMPRPAYGGPAPADQPARDEILSRLDRTIVVHAGAGTGKTTALVGRIVALVSSGEVALGDIAAITFTEAAAAELRDRIRVRLEAGAADSALPAVVRDRIRAARGEIDTAAITTLHGFAQRLLAEHPLEAGLPPRFQVLDEVEASMWFDVRWEAFVAALSADPLWRPVLVRAHAVGLDVASLRQVGLALWDQTDRVGSAPGAGPRLPSVDVSAVLTLLDGLDADLDLCTDADDGLARHGRALSSHLRPLRAPEPPGRPDAARGGDGDGAAGPGAPDATGTTTAAGADAVLDVLDVLDLLGRCPRRRVGKVGRRENWPDIAAVRGRATALTGAVDDVVAHQRTAILDRLLGRIHAFVVELAAERVREGHLTFHDLLVVARDLLRADARVRASAGMRHRRLLIDEFQDTDPLQIELAVLLTTAEPQAGELPWDRALPEPGRLFVAGDPTQSIYRFRRADLALYHRVERVLGEPGCELSVNFRSVPGVLAWVDHVFARLLEGAEPGVQATHRPLRAHRADVGSAHPPVAVFGGPLDAGAAEVRAEEARQVAGAVARIVSDGWTVTDPSTGETRAARHHDIALLIPDRTALGPIETALGAAGIPARVESRSFVLDSVEVRELVGILTAIDDPTDEIALIGALRSPAFGCGDDDLLGYHDAGGRWSYLARQPPGLDPAHPVVAAMASLSRLHTEAAWQRVSDTVASVISRRRVLATAMGRPRPRDHWRRYRYLLDTARAFDDAAAGGRREFLAWVGRRLADRARAPESPGSEPDDDAVRVLTVHGAKGLEFPVVVLAGLHRDGRRRTGPVLWRPGGGYEAALGSASAGSAVSTGGFEALDAVERRLDEAERIRVLYVAATRARDHLLVSLNHRAGRPCHAAALHALHAPGGDAPAVRLDPAPWPAPDAARPPVAARPGPLPTGPDELDGLDGADHPDHAEGPDDADHGRVARRRAVLARAARPATVSATAIARAAPVVHGGHHPPVPRASDGSGPAAGPGRGADASHRRTAMRVGRAVHGVLQHVELPGARDLAAVAGAQAAAEGVPERTDEVAELAAGVVRSPVVAGLLASGRWWREVPVAAPLGDVVLEGVVDLLVDTPEGLVVVDYKTDHLPDDAAVAAAVDRYTPQGAAYSYALEAATGLPVVRCTFVFARRPGPAVARDVADLGAAVTRLVEQTAGAGAAV